MFSKSSSINLGRRVINHWDQNYIHFEPSDVKKFLPLLVFSNSLPELQVNITADIKQIFDHRQQTET